MVADPAFRGPGAASFLLLIDHDRGVFVIQFDKDYGWVGFGTEAAKTVRDALSKFLETRN